MSLWKFVALYVVCVGFLVVAITRPWWSPTKRQRALQRANER